MGGGTPPKATATYYGGDIPWATIRDMHSAELSETEHSITTLGLTHSSAKLIPAGEVIMASRVGLGKACILKQDTAINQDIRALIPRQPTEIDRRFCLYWLQSVSDQIVGAGSGATVQGIKLPFIKSLPFPAIQLEEQKRIVAVLDQAFAALDRARAHAEANLADAGEIFQRSTAALFEQVSKETRAVSTVAEIAEGRKASIRTGPFGSQLKHGEFVEEGICVLGIDNAVRNEFRWGKPRHITPEKYETLSRYLVHPGDVIITIMGTCGRCAIIPDDIPVAINTKHLCCITLDRSKCLPEYLHRYFLLSPRALAYLASQTKGTVMDGLNMGIIRELPVDLPSLDEQRRICGKIEGIHQNTQDLARLYTNELADIADLRQSLLQKAFSGQLTG